MLTAKPDVVSSAPIASQVRILRVPAAALLLLGVLLFHSSVSPSFDQSDFCVVIDAGSSGTRIHVFTFSSPQKSIGQQRSSGQRTLPLLQDASGLPIRQLSRKQRAQARISSKLETEPGLDKFLNKKEELRTRSIGPLLSWALSRVPVKKHASTPLFLFATAGVRKLAPEDSQWILEASRELLAASPFLFKPDFAKVITGSEEATFGWVALNYLKNTLSDSNSHTTLGVLDLGGSSLEITFELPEGHGASVFASKVVLGSRSMSLYARSFEGFGMNDAFDWTVGELLSSGSFTQSRHLLEKEVHAQTSKVSGTGSDKGWLTLAGRVYGGRMGNASEAESGVERSAERSGSGSGGVTSGGALELEHPCLHQGHRKAHEHKIRSTAVGQSPGTADGGERGGTLSPTSVPVPARVPLVIVGKPDVEACRRLARLAVVRNRSKQECSLPECALGVHGQPQFDARFVALTGFHIVTQFFSDSFASPSKGSTVESSGLPSLGLQDIVERGAEFCSEKWEDVEAKYGRIRGADMNCFRAPYMVSLIQQGLGLQQSQLVLGEGQGMSWTLGAALLKGLPAITRLRAEAPSKKLLSPYYSRLNRGVGGTLSQQNSLDPDVTWTRRSASGNLPVGLLSGVMALFLALVLVLAVSALPKGMLRSHATEGAASWHKSIVHVPFLSDAKLKSSTPETLSPCQSQRPDVVSSAHPSLVLGSPGHSGTLHPRRSSPEKESIR